MDLLTQIALNIVIQCKEKGVMLEEELVSVSMGRKVGQEFLDLLNAEVNGLSQRSRGSVAFKSKFAFSDGSGNKPTWGMSGSEVIFRAARSAILSKTAELDSKLKQVLATS